jgi:hypothetical protein
LLKIKYMYTAYVAVEWLLKVMNYKPNTIKVLRATDNLLMAG